MGFIFLLLVITVFLFFPLTTYILFWYETANSAYRDELDRISDGKTGRWIFKAWISSILSQGVLIACLPLALIRQLWRPSPGAGAASPPVILIHGLYHNASAWIRFRWALKRTGFERVYAFNYSSFGPSSQEICERLERWLEGISRDFPGEGIVLVGHSMGGLLARAYAARNSVSHSPAVRGIVTLGTPYGGSKMVVFGIGRLARSLAWGGPLIRELEGDQVPSGVLRVALHSPVDNLVLPASSLTPPAGWQDEITNPICHMTMLYHGPTIRQVLDHIKDVGIPPQA